MYLFIFLYLGIDIMVTNVVYLSGLRNVNQNSNLDIGEVVLRLLPHLFIHFLYFQIPQMMVNSITLHYYLSLKQF